MFQDAFSLLAYSNPWASPLGWQLCPSRRESVCAALNSAILGKTLVCSFIITGIIHPQFSVFFRIDDLLVAAAAGGVHSTCLRTTPPDVQFIPWSVCVCQCGRCSHPAAAPLTTTNSSAVLFFERLNSTAPKLHPPTDTHT